MNNNELNENNKIMSVDNFIEQCKKDDFNIVSKWDKTKFGVFCMKCLSNDVVVMFREEEGRMGSEYTGYMRGFMHDNGLITKCKNCGNAMIIDNIEY